MRSAAEPSALCTVIEPVVPSAGADGKVIVSGVSTQACVVPESVPVTGPVSALAAAAPPVIVLAIRTRTLHRAAKFSSSPTGIAQN